MPDGRGAGGKGEGIMQYKWPFTETAMGIYSTAEEIQSIIL